MNIDLVVIGKTAFDYINTAIELYSKRLNKYTTFNVIVLPDIKGAKNMSVELLKTKEGEMLCQHLQKYDSIVLLDEHGKEYTSINFANWIESKMLRSTKRMAVVIGGAYGFSQQVYEMANEKISLSKMTFSHQMIRILIVEQIYRAFTILRGEPYHHE